MLIWGWSSGIIDSNHNSITECTSSFYQLSLTVSDEAHFATRKVTSWLIKCNSGVASATSISALVAISLMMDAVWMRVPDF